MAICTVFVVAILFVMQMMFSVDMLNTKVVYNFLIFPVLKFHDFRPDGSGVIDFTMFAVRFCMLSVQI